MFASPANALPFMPNRESFVKWANSRTWDDGSVVYFQPSTKCIFPNNPLVGAECIEGFVTITNPMGTKVCELDSMVYWVSFRGLRYKVKNCRFR